MIKVPLYSVRLFKSRMVRYGERHAIDEEDAAAEFFHRLIGCADREHFAALFLDAACKPTGATLIGIGTLTDARVHPREVFKAAILANAYAVLLAHNHPSGDITPSASDVRSTRWLAGAGRIIGIRVVDHLIVTPRGAFVSLRRLGLLGKE